MSVGAYGLSSHALVCLALLQGIIQGVLMALLSNFLTSKTNHPIWLKIYVIFTNILTGLQTVIHVIQAFESIDSAIPQAEKLVLAAPVLTGLISALVQPYFMHRCWRIYQRRIILVIPLVLLWITSFVSIISLLQGIFLAQTFARPPSQAMRI
ncbi:unnamed protein product, partial [Rhizoctonia solani]